MFKGDSLLLTTEGYKRIEDIHEPVEAICEYGVHGETFFSTQPATVTRQHGTVAMAHIMSRSGRFLVGDYASTWFLTNGVLQRRRPYRGTWRYWQDCTTGKPEVVMSREGVRATIDLTEDDWVFYAYGFNNTEDDTMPVSQPTRQEQKNVLFTERREEWPEWYWDCTLAEKILFLRGLYDAHARITTRRIYLGCRTAAFANSLVIALSEFGIRASRFISQQPTWAHRRAEYVVDVRNYQSVVRLSERICWHDEAMPSFRFAEIARQARRFIARNMTVPTTTPITLRQPRPTTELRYMLEVANTHSCTINGFITRDSTQHI